MPKNQISACVGSLGKQVDSFGEELKFNPGTNLYNKDLPLAAEVGKSLGADIPVVESLSRLGTKLNGGKVSI